MTDRISRMTVLLTAGFLLSLHCPHAIQAGTQEGQQFKESLRSPPAIKGILFKRQLNFGPPKEKRTDTVNGRKVIINPVNSDYNFGVYGRNGYFVANFGKRPEDVRRALREKNYISTAAHYDRTFWSQTPDGRIDLYERPSDLEAAEQVSPVKSAETWKRILLEVVHLGVKDLKVQSLRWEGDRFFAESNSGGSISGSIDAYEGGRAKRVTYFSETGRPRERTILYTYDDTWQHSNRPRTIRVERSSDRTPIVEYTVLELELGAPRNLRARYSAENFFKPRDGGIIYYTNDTQRGVPPTRPREAGDPRLKSDGLPPISDAREVRQSPEGADGNNTLLMFAVLAALGAPPAVLMLYLLRKNPGRKTQTGE